MRIAWWLIGALLVMSCAGGTGSSGEGGGGAGGCPDNLPASCPSDAPGYAATIGPLITQRCVYCHTAGGGSSLATYNAVYTSRGAVLNQVLACKMPLAGSTPLTSAERSELMAWLVCGAQNN